MTAELGKVASLWRYPVKSMQGEELSEAEMTQHGLLRNSDQIMEVVRRCETDLALSVGIHGNKRPAAVGTIGCVA